MVIVAGDASKAETVASMLEAARAIGNFQGFIHAAGLLHPGPYIWELSSGDFQAVFAANVMAGHQWIRYCLPDLLSKGEGLAVFFGSGAAEKTQPGIAAYCAAKAAEEHLARRLAAEAPSVTTLIYRPGIVETRMQVQARKSQGGAARAASGRVSALEGAGAADDPGAILSGTGPAAGQGPTPPSWRELGRASL